MHKNLPDPNYFLNRKIPSMEDYEIVEFKGKGNNALVFRAHSDKANNDFACKIIPKANLAQGWKAEIDKANILKTRIVVKFSHLGDWIDKNNGIECIYLISEFVNGATLEKYAKQQKGLISVSFIELFLKAIFSFFNDMQRCRVDHGDLHAKNIMVEDRSDQLGEDDHAFRVTDFGVTTATSGGTAKDDYEQLATVVRLLLANVNYSLASSRDKYVFNIINDNFLARHLTERDTTRDSLARQPSKLFKRLEKADEDFVVEQRKVSQEARLVTPFDYLSCEQIGDSHSLLKALYSRMFLGLQQIESRNNLVLTGPRGCGKSTVFKSLSLRHRSLVSDNDPKEIQYIGIYYRCDDLYFAFPRYTLPDKPTAYDIPMHYITSVLLHEVLDTVELWSRHHFSDEFAKNEGYVATKIWDVLSLEPPREPGVNTFKAIRFRLQKEMRRAAKKQRFISTEQPIGYYFGPEILLRSCETMIKMFSFLQQRPFYFFVDDYSIPKITSKLQRNLNRLLMQRSSSCFFKISTESPISYMRSDIDGKEYVEGREFELLNLGLVYLTAQPHKILLFLEDVFTRRFKTIPEYPVSKLEELVGNYKLPPANDMALAFRNGEKPELWGKEVLGKLCSGDIFYIISLVKRMVAAIGEQAGLSSLKDSPKISKDFQKRAIREEAGSFMNSLRGIKDGEQLVEVVTAFGKVAHSYMRFKNSKNEERNPPYLASRIEPLEELKLSSYAHVIYSELLRYSLFIEDPRGKSRRGRIVPRLFLRRALLPHFNLTFSNRDSIQLANKDFESLLMHPKKFEKTFELRKPEDSSQMIMKDLFKNPTDNSN